MDTKVLKIVIKKIIWLRKNNIYSNIEKGHQNSYIRAPKKLFFIRSYWSNELTIVHNVYVLLGSLFLSGGIVREPTTIHACSKASAPSL